MNKDKIVCGIYKIQNKNNKQIYIGQSINIYERFRKHKQIPDNFDIHKAMKEEGIDNFTFEIIEECPQELLNEREKYWVSYYDSYNNGYNMTAGGAGAPMSNNKKVNQYDLQDNYIRTFDSCKEAAESVGLTSATCIVRVCNGKQKTTKGYKWKYCDN